MSPPSQAKIFVDAESRIPIEIITAGEYPGDGKPASPAVPAIPGSKEAGATGHPPLHKRVGYLPSRLRSGRYFRMNASECSTQAARRASRSRASSSP